MTERPGAILRIPLFNLARLGGRTRNALIGGMFGAAWLFNGVYWGRIGGHALSTAVALCGIAFVIWPATRLRSPRRLSLSGEERQDSMALRCRTELTSQSNGWPVLAPSSGLLTHAVTSRYDLIPQSFGVVIGIMRPEPSWHREC
jgi:hypothetical protein